MRFLKLPFDFLQGPQGEPGPPGQQGNPGTQVSDEQVVCHLIFSHPSNKLFWAFSILSAGTCRAPRSHRAARRQGKTSQDPPCYYNHVTGRFCNPTGKARAASSMKRQINAFQKSVKWQEIVSFICMSWKPSCSYHTCIHITAHKQCLLQTLILINVNQISA